ncbi:hypothetical protein ALQ85_200066 [Pseudomonas syringae]|nr:hypothetical protein ALQ85_200066 [Pseudomonas syringae]
MRIARKTSRMNISIPLCRGQIPRFRSPFLWGVVGMAQSIPIVIKSFR